MLIALKKKKYPATRCILDCTEIKVCKPSSLRARSKCFSTYKNITTAKGLLRIAPSGVPVFISDLYTGSISDTDMRRQSESLELLEKGDDCMADRGFKIKNLLDPIEVTLNIPPFLSEKGQFCEEVETTQSIASVRIHVERAINCGMRNGAKFNESKSLPTSTTNLQFNIFFLQQQ